MSRFVGVNASIADILSSEVKDGEVRVQVGDFATQTGWGQNASVWGPDGFFSRPNDPDADGAAMALVLEGGNAKRIFGARDNRFSPRVGEMMPGDRMIVSRGEARFLLKAEKDGIALYTANQLDGGSSMLVSLEGESGLLQTFNGQTTITQTKDRVLIAAGAAFIDMDAVTGQIRISGQVVWVGGGSTLLGQMPGGGAPVPGLTSALIGPSALAGIPSSTVTIAP